MARRKNITPLEVIRKTGVGGPLRPAARDESEAAASDAPPRERQRVTAWLGDPVHLRASRAVMILLVLLAGGVVAGAYMGGRMQEKRASADELSRATMEGLRGQAPNPAINPWATAEDGSTQRVVTIDDEGDPRRPGLNYFTLETMPARSEDEGQRAVEYLRSQGLDAALIPANNGRLLELTVLRGFERPRSDPEARQLERQLRALGRQWKAEHRGWSDWSDLYPKPAR